MTVLILIDSKETGFCDKENYNGIEVLLVISNLDLIIDWAFINIQKHGGSNNVEDVQLQASQACNK